MIALDTNVLIRFLVRDDRTQAENAAHFLQEELSAEQPGYVSTAAVVELEWVLRKGYGFQSEAIQTAIIKMLESPNLVFEAEDAVRLAAADGHGDFVDRLIHFVGADAGCDRTVTFDRKFAPLPGVELLKS